MKDKDVKELECREIGNGGGVDSLAVGYVLELKDKYRGMSNIAEELAKSYAFNEFARGHQKVSNDTIEYQVNHEYMTNKQFRNTVDTFVGGTLVILQKHLNRIST